jgi:phosphoribosylformylglycinamidine synthase
LSANVLILTGYGINAEKELEWAFQLSGGKTKIIHIEDLIENNKILDDYQILAFPGGFSFGDHIASGRIYANLVKNKAIDKISKFIDSDRLVIGICNGFQIITKLGLLPDLDNSKIQTASLMENDSGHFEDRWVYLKIINNESPWLKGIESLYLPVRHGEGKFVVKDNDILNSIKKNNQIALKYFNPDSENTEYPFNPNGSIENIAGILNKKGNVFGLMPHPEAFIFNENHPRWQIEDISDQKRGLDIFKNAMDYFK